MIKNADDGLKDFLPAILILEIFLVQEDPMDTEALQAAVEAIPNSMLRELSVQLNTTHTMIISFQVFMSWERSENWSWIPHDLNESQQNQRLTICTSLLSKDTKEPFFEKVMKNEFFTITSNEKDDS